MSEGQTRITSLTEPNPVLQGNYVPSLTSFKSNTFRDHFVVSMSVEGTDESPMGYVDKRAAVDLACHFVAVANELGADLQVYSRATVAQQRGDSYALGYKNGRDGEAIQRGVDLDNIAAKLRELADELS